MKIKADFLERLRKERGLTQVQLANRLGITQGTFALYETGKRNPKIETVKKIAKALNVGWSMLCDEDDSEQALDPSDDDFGAACNRSVRCCLDGQSSMFSLVCRYIIPLLPKMTDETLGCFERDIAERKRTGFDFGYSYDYKTWDAFYKAVCKEIERRKGNGSQTD